MCTLCFGSNTAFMSFASSWGYAVGDSSGEPEVPPAALGNQYRCVLSIVPSVSECNAFKIHRISIAGDYEDRSVHVVK